MPLNVARSLLFVSLQKFTRHKHGIILQKNNKKSPQVAMAGAIKLLRPQMQSLAIYVTKQATAKN